MWASTNQLSLRCFLFETKLSTHEQVTWGGVSCRNGGLICAVNILRSPNRGLCLLAPQITANLSYHRHPLVSISSEKRRQVREPTQTRNALWSLSHYRSKLGYVSYHNSNVIFLTHYKTSVSQATSGYSSYLPWRWTQPVSKKLVLTHHWHDCSADRILQHNKYYCSWNVHFAANSRTALRPNSS